MTRRASSTTDLRAPRVAVAVELGASHLTEVVFHRAHPHAALARLLFGQTDGGDLGCSEDDLWNRSRIGGGRPCRPRGRLGSLAVAGGARRDGVGAVVDGEQNAPVRGDRREPSRRTRLDGPPPFAETTRVAEDHAASMRVPAGFPELRRQVDVKKMVSE